MTLLQARENMIEQQIRPWDVLDQRVLDAIGDIPREKYVDQEHEGVAYSDYQLPIGHGQVMLNPNVDARIVQTLDIGPTDSILEIGTGSGYVTTCLSRLAGKVETVEIVEALASAAENRLKSMGVSNTTFHNLDASIEWDAADAYDAIVLTGSVEQIPDFYKHKMALQGRLCAIVGSISSPAMNVVKLTRIGTEEWISDSLFETVAPPLVNFNADSSEKIFLF